MRENHFGPDVAQRYDESSSDMFARELVDATVDFLVGLAGGTRSLTCVWEKEQ